MNAWLWLTAYLVAINTLTFMAFGWDKRKARDDGQRISESNLLSLAFFGGSPAAKFAQRRFRHKTRKQPFALQLNIVVGLQIASIFAATGWLVWN